MTNTNNIPAYIDIPDPKVAAWKITQTFHPSTVIAGLLLNAAMAGATVISIAIDGNRLRVADNGSGIADPAVVFTLGRSAWPEAYTVRGGFLARLSKAGTVISSRHEDAATGWRVEVPCDLIKRTRLTVTNVADADVGTIVEVDLPEHWMSSIDDIVAKAAPRAGIPVSYTRLVKGELSISNFEPEDVLSGRRVIEETPDYRIAMVEDRCGLLEVNIGPLRLSTNMPSVQAPIGGAQYSAVVELLGYTGPRPSESYTAIENEDAAALRQIALRAIYRHVSRLDSHQFGRTHRNAAKLHGIEIGEPAPLLNVWKAKDADGHRECAEPRPVRPGDFKLAATDIALDDVAMARALHLASDQSTNIPTAFMCEPEYEGVAWYEAMHAGEFAGVSLSAGGRELFFDSLEQPYISQDTERAAQIDTIDKDPRPAAMTIRLRIGGELYSYSTDIMVIGGGDLDDSRIVLHRDNPNGLDVDAVAGFAQDALFTFDEESSNGCWDIQVDDFQEDARDEIRALMLGEDEAQVDALQYAVDKHLRCFLDDGDFVTIANTSGADRPIVSVVKAPCFELIKV